ncbi:MAG TPA: VWA domain-containing protein, partial [Ktedonobacteraceae bacterium]|nr:VWA domain-containing protein [Ktedonobacteraceae bacterium]
TFFSSPIGGDTIIILQTSASMQATDVAPNRFEAARNRVADLIDGLGPGDQVSLIAMARTPQVIIASSSDRGQLDAALARVRVTNQDADLQQALSLATSLAAGHSDARILIVGDGHVLTPDSVIQVPLPVSYLEVGTDAPNAALLSLASDTVQGNLVALAQIANYSHQTRALPVELYADGKLVNVQTISLSAETSGVLQWEPLPPTTRFLYAHIIVQDDMKADHEAWAIVGGSMHGRALLVTGGNSFLESALRIQPNLDLFETTPAKYTSGGNFDLTIFDGYVPPILPSGDIFFVNPPAGSYIFGTSGPEVAVTRISAGNGDANILNEVDLSSIHTLHVSHQIIPAPSMQPVIVTPETPLLIAGEQANRRVAALSFDLHDSDLPLQPGFPVLMYNLVNWFLPPPVAGNGQVAPSTAISIAPWPGVNRITITGPGQQPITVAPPFPVTAYNQTDTPGIYDVTQYSSGPGGQVRHGAFVVNLFDPLQSRLAPADLLPIAHSTAFNASGPGIPHVLREIWPWIAAFLLLVLCLEWWLFSRSYTLRTTPSSRKTAETGLPSFRRGGGGVDGWWGPSWPPARQVIANVQSRYKTITKRIKRARKRRGGGRAGNVGTPLVGVRGGGVRPDGNKRKGKRNADV